LTMNASPQLPPPQKTPSRISFIVISVVVIVGAALVAWQLISRQREINDLRRTALEMAVRNNLRQIAASAAQDFMENKVKTVKLEQLVGPGKYMSKLTLVDGENYAALDLTDGVTPWKVVTAGGISVVHQR